MSFFKELFLWVKEYHRTRKRRAETNAVVERVVAALKARYTNQRPAFFLRLHQCGSITYHQHSNDPPVGLFKTPEWGEQLTKEEIDRMRRKRVNLRPLTFSNESEVTS